MIVFNTSVDSRRKLSGTLEKVFGQSIALRTSDCQAANKGMTVRKTKCGFIRDPLCKKVRIFFPYICSISYDEILIYSQPVLHSHNYAYKGDKGSFHKPSSFSLRFLSFRGATLTKLQNGVGAFILQCKRLDFHYCDWAGSSKGMKYGQWFTFNSLWILL